MCSSPYTIPASRTGESRGNLLLDQRTLWDWQTRSLGRSYEQAVRKSFSHLAEPERMRQCSSY